MMESVDVWIRQGTDKGKEIKKEVDFCINICNLKICIAD